METLSLSPSGLRLFSISFPLRKLDAKVLWSDKKLILNYFFKLFLVDLEGDITSVPLLWIFSSLTEVYIFEYLKIKDNSNLY